MASSFNNRHWPSMFRSKHAAEPWQAHAADITSSPPPPVLSAGGNNTSSGYAGGEVRTADPKPRWNPRPEQIRILEAIFNSGMVNPPRDEIPRIRMRLQEYGQVADANVFYWFQNRKARSKNKLRYAAAPRSPPPRRAASAAASPPPVVTPPPQLMNQQHLQLLASSPVQAAPTSSSSSSSDRSSGSSKPAAKRPAQGMSPTNAAMDLLGPLAAACPQQMYYQGRPMAPASPPAYHKVQDLVDEAIFQPWPQGYCLSAAEVAAILGGQYSMQQVPVVQQQPSPALSAGAFLGLCNGEVTGPATITGGQRTCNWPGAGLGQYCPADHHQIGSKNTGAAANAAVVSREEHVDATKLGFLQYCFGDSTASVAATSPPITATPEAAVTVATVVATTVGLTGGLLPANTAAPNGVIANYDLLQLQGLATDGALGVGVTTTTTVAAAAEAPTPVAQEEAAAGVAALWITDSVTGRSVAHSVAAVRLDVREQFGEGALLFRCAGERGLDLEPVLVDESSGCTVQPLQHGAFYYLVV